MHCRRVPSFHSDHSTPSVQAMGEFTDTCFDFEALKSPLPFSPVGSPQPLQALNDSQSSISISSSIVSPGKRKPALGMYDIPIEKPNKKQKKKSKPVVEQVCCFHVFNYYKEIKHASACYVEI